MKLLSNSIKISKTQSKFPCLKYKILYLSPGALCPNSTIGCRASCFGKTGRFNPKMSSGKAMLARTKLYETNVLFFKEQLTKEINSLLKGCKKKNLKLCLRLDGTSETELWKEFSLKFPDIQFIEYTKNFETYKTWLNSKKGNVFLIFSRSEDNETQCKEVLMLGGRVAVVFRGKIPPKWMDYEVINGDSHDARHLDGNYNEGIVIGLLAKGNAKKDRTGFVVDLEAYEGP